jgi:hypothetical protein
VWLDIQFIRERTASASDDGRAPRGPHRNHGAFIFQNESNAATALFHPGNQFNTPLLIIQFNLIHIAADINRDHPITLAGDLLVFANKPVDALSGSQRARPRTHHGCRYPLDGGLPRPGPFRTSESRTI